jgi:hypothetical protein
MEPGDILKNRLKRAGITPEEYSRAIHPPTTDDTSSKKMMRKLEVYNKMQPGKEKTALWSEIEELMPKVADELQELRNRRPSAYVLMDQIKEEEVKLQARLPKIEKVTFWSLLFGKKK